MVFQQVSDRVYADTGTVGSGNAGAIILDDRAIVIDAQYVATGQSLRSNIERVSRKKITHLLLTHSHSDHVFGNQVFEDCEIVAHESLKTRMEELLRTSWSRESLQKQVSELRKTDPDRASRFENVRIVLPNKTFREKFSLGEGDMKVEMIHTGGHTADSSIVYFGRSRTLFASDLIFCGIYPYGGDPTADPDLWTEALNKIRAMNPDVIVPGHGPICHIDEIERYTRYLSETKSIMLDLIAQGKSEDQAAADASLPQFYEEGAGTRRNASLVQWYRIWKQRTVDKPR
ncbi:MAG: MBL fold metallo-hydrolase [archaeon]